MGKLLARLLRHGGHLSKRCQESGYADGRGRARERPSGWLLGRTERGSPALADFAQQGTAIWHWRHAELIGAGQGCSSADASEGDSLPRISRWVRVELTLVSQGHSRKNSP